MKQLLMKGLRRNMKKTYETPSNEIVLRDVEHIFTMISGGTGDRGNIDSVDFNDIRFS